MVIGSEVDAVAQDTHAECDASMVSANGVGEVQLHKVSVSQDFHFPMFVCHGPTAVPVANVFKVTPTFEPGIGYGQS